MYFVLLLFTFVLFIVCFCFVFDLWTEFSTLFILQYVRIMHDYAYYISGYVYMNGDVGKLPSGVVYATPDSGPSMGAAPEYIAVNGVAEGAEGPPPTSPSAPQDSTQAYSLPQLKLLLSQQLEYYFSR